MKRKISFHILVIAVGLSMTYLGWLFGIFMLYVPVGRVVSLCFMAAGMGMVASSAMAYFKSEEGKNAQKT